MFHKTENSVNMGEWGEIQGPEEEKSYTSLMDLWLLRGQGAFENFWTKSNTSDKNNQLPFQQHLMANGHLRFNMPQNIGRTDVEAETPILWPPDAKS